MKKALKSIIVAILGWQVRRLRKKHAFKIVVVVGGIGKTSTKFAIGRVLQQSHRVIFQEGNYNDIVSVPLVLFGQEMPSLLNPLAWYRILRANEKVIHGPYPYDIVLLELGTDGPGQIGAFKKYLHADVAVVTALTAEHMVYFKDLQAVIDEELSVASYTDTIIYNADLTKEKDFSKIEQKVSYGIKNKADYMAEGIERTDGYLTAHIRRKDGQVAHVSYQAVSKSQLYSALAAYVVGEHFSVPPEAIIRGLQSVKPVNGRMQLLRGKRDTTIIDDTYNASPDAVKAALDTLYEVPAPQKIAILGNMNELGAMSAEAHRSIGAYCDPKKLEFIATLGPDANTYLAEAAEKNGCEVQRFSSPYEAGDYIAGRMAISALILAKGSQNGVYAEEALKALLADKSDQTKLVRQSPQWLKIKRKQFGNGLPERG